MKFQHIRHATHRLEYGGMTILVDPVLNPKGSTPPIPGAPHQMPNPLTALPVPLEKLTDSDVVLVTHMHGDHFDDAAAAALPKDTPILCSPHDAAALQAKEFHHVIKIGDVVSHKGIRVLRTGGTHGTGPSAQILNPVSGYVLSAPQEPTVYITGDSVWCPEMENILATHHPNVIIAFGGAALYQGDIITMDIPDFEHIRKTCPDATLIIIHLEAWNHCGLTRKEINAWVKETKQEPWVRVPEDGESIQP